MLGRGTNWRQGSVVPKQLVELLDLPDSMDDQVLVVVISHDCDIAHESELKIEVIVGCTKESADGNFRNAKNPRKIHLKYSNEQANSCCVVELKHANLVRLDQSKFTDQDPDLRYELADNEKRCLRQWLASRYARPAYPNALENRLSAKMGSKSLESKFSTILSSISTYLVAVFFDLHGDRHVEKESGEPYYLSISLIYDSEEHAGEGREMVESVIDPIKELFTQAENSASTGGTIVLEHCDCIAETKYSIADMRRTDQWRVEHLSLRDGENVQPSMLQGTTPG